MKYPFPVFAIVVLFCAAIRMDDEDLAELSLIMIPIKPLHYDVYINISLETSSFKGNVEINFEALSYTKDITVYASQLKITHIKLFHEGQRRNINQTIEINDTLCMIFNPQLDAGVYTIKMDYAGNFSTSKIGLYATKYEFEELGYPGSAAVTYFQPKYARNVFPCFDDPTLKATFNISISRDKNNIAISNMPLKLTKDISKNQAIDIFEVTPRFSTNQVAFAVCNFARTSYPRGNIYTKPSPSFFHRAYLSEISESILREIENYFHMPLPMKKVDIMTVRDLPRKDGGVGNWGLVLLSENNLFHDHKVNKTMGDQDTLLTLIHVYLHGLLGHVCNEAWDGCSWLTEGIATFLQYSIGDQLRPEWRLLEQRSLILLRDIVDIDHEIDTVNPPKKSMPREKTELYKKLYNAKAAAIMLTLKSMVRRSNLQFGLQHFAYRSLDICSFGGKVTLEDFWLSLQEVVDNEKPKVKFIPPLKIKNIAMIMKTWGETAEIPVLYAFRRYTAPFGIEIEQYAVNQHMEETAAKFYIPINYATESKLYFKRLRPTGGFKEPNKRYIFPHDVHEDKWYIINAEAAYAYVVRYDEINWKRLANALNSENFGNIPPLSRAKLLFDAFTLPRVRRLNYSTILDLLKYLWREKDYIPLNSLFGVFETFYSRFAEIEKFSYLEAFLARALQPALEHVGFQVNQTLSRNHQHIDNLNRLQIIKWACRLGNQLCRKTTTRMLRENFFLLPHDLREVVVCGGLIDAEWEIWNTLLFYSNNEPDEAIMNGLGCSQNASILNIYIENTITHNVSVFHEIYPRGYFGINFVLNYLVHNWKKVYESLIEKDKKDLIRGVVRHITRSEQIAMLESIRTNLSMPELDATFKSAIEDAKHWVLSVNYHAGDITQWIKNELISEGSSTVNVSFYVLLVILIVIF